MPCFQCHAHMPRLTWRARLKHFFPILLIYEVPMGRARFNISGACLDRTKNENASLKSEMNLGGQQATRKLATIGLAKAKKRDH